MQETLDSKKSADSAFRAKDYTTAIDSYTQVSPLSQNNLRLVGNNHAFIEQALVNLQSGNKISTFNFCLSGANIFSLFPVVVH